MKKRLLAVQGPLQFIAGYIAFDWRRKTQDSAEESENILLLYDFLAPPDIESDIADSVLQLTKSSNWSKIIFIRSTEMRALMRGKYTNCIKHLHDTLGYSYFDEIFLARDHIGDGSPLLINAYPEATRLAYGDSFGLVGQRAMPERIDWSSPMRSSLSILRRKILRTLWGGPKVFAFDAAVLTLPLDISGTYLLTTPLVVPPRAHVVECVGRIHDSLETLSAYCESLLENGSGTEDKLYLLSNLGASGLTSTEKEIALYIEIIEQTSRSGSTIFIKHHPRSSHEVLDAVISHLEKSYRIVVLDRDSFSRIPIELWRKLISHCSIVAMFSTSAINLKYLYGTDVVLPLNAERIKTYILPEKISHITTVDQMIRQSIEKLEEWDQESVLWGKSA